MNKLKYQKSTIILGIESSCDETACALVRNGHEILSHTVTSQIDRHQPYGGVYPELASRCHFEDILPVIEKTINQAGVSHHEIDAIAVAHGPGLIGSLLVGLNVAKALALGWSIPFVAVNHVEAHLYAALMGEKRAQFPALGLVLSGGHTFLVKMQEIGSYELLGTTVDDAIGEAFDKVGSMLNLSYPAGAALEKLASTGDPTSYHFSAGRVKNAPLNFSFSGLKTNVLYTEKTEKNRADIAASFQETAFQDVASKTALAASKGSYRSLLVGGGVSQNRRLQEILRKQLPSLDLLFPPLGLSVDNAVMIAGLGYHNFLKKKSGDNFLLEPKTRIPLGNIQNKLYNS